ncbi:MAG TPA: DNA integrity scanning diadenylate cyclase DisA [Acidimicrobiales bacterium]|nr:DNA integrity scanning diadenylate cyclase DisA [Acidimicrobiales bacterium]
MTRVPPRSPAMTEALSAVAPGTALREGLDRILQANTGALIVLGDDASVLSICSGGFLLDAEFSPQRLSELAKMDGAIILARDASHIARANVHLVPDPTVPTSETGTRHRTAERVARSLDVPVISVSEAMSLIAVYRGGQKHPLETIPRLLNRANQALQTLERYKNRLDVVSSALGALEVEDLVTVRDVVVLLQRSEMVRRIAEEVNEYVVELGSDGRLILLQLEELMGGVEDDRHLVVRDYLRAAAHLEVAEAVDRLGALTTDDLLDLKTVAWILGIPTDAGGLDAALQPHGYRLLSRIPRLPAAVVERIADHFGGLQRIMRASVEELDEVEGVGSGRAKAIREGLTRLAESSILDRYT